MGKKHLFGLSVITKQAKGGYVAMFPHNRFHIQGYGENMQDALARLNERLVEIVEGTRNPL